MKKKVVVKDFRNEVVELIKGSKKQSLDVNGKFVSDEFNLVGGFPFPIIQLNGKPVVCLVDMNEAEAIHLLLDGLGDFGGGSPQSFLSRILINQGFEEPERIRELILSLDKLMIRIGHEPQ